MSWIYLDDQFAEHPKIVGLSDRAFRAHVRTLCYCGRHTTDGLVSSDSARALGISKRTANELVAAGIWEQHNDGWRVHDYLDWQDSREEVLARREKASEAGKARVRGARRDAAGRLVRASTPGASAALDGTLGVGGPASPADDPASPAPAPTPTPRASSREVQERLDAVFAKLGCADELLKRRLAKDPAIAVVVSKLELLAEKPGRPGASPSSRIVSYLTACEDAIEAERRRVRGRQFGALPPGGQRTLAIEKLRAEGWHALTDNERAALPVEIQVHEQEAAMAVLATAVPR